MNDAMTSFFMAIAVGIIIYFMVSKAIGVTRDRKQIIYSVEIYQITASIKQQKMPETQRILKLLSQTNVSQADIEKQNNQLTSIIQKLHEENKAVILAEREYFHLADLLILTNVPELTKVTPYIFNEHVYSYGHYKILKDAINPDTYQKMIDEKHVTFEHQLKPSLE